MNDNIPQTEIICFECKRPKPISDFRKWAIRENKQLYCKLCRRLITYRTHNANTVEYRKSYYNREEVKERHRKQGKKFWDNLKLDPIRHAEFRKRSNENHKKYLISHPCKKVAKSLKNRDKLSIVTPLDVWKIVKKQKRKCALSGRKLTTENISPDHIICLINGGKSVPENIRLVTKEINVARHLMTDANFIQLCSDVVRSNMPHNGQ